MSTNGPTNGRWLLVAAIAMVALGCSEKGGAARPPRPEEIPEMKAVEGGKVVLGLAFGSLREDRGISRFQIAKYPITVRRYKECVAAGACSYPEARTSACGAYAVTGSASGPTYDVPGADDLPVTCVSPKDAANYCRWIGGRLPDSSEWLVAARGNQVRRFSWGNTEAHCAQHAATKPSDECAKSEDIESRVGTHPARASPAGMEDVLLTESELLAPSSTSLFSVCTGPCIVTGRGGGAIDGFAPAPVKAKGAEDEVSGVYGFRCVVEAG